jgi:hypothetical protein
LVKSSPPRGITGARNGEKRYLVEFMENARSAWWFVDSIWIGYIFFLVYPVFCV